MPSVCVVSPVRESPITADGCTVVVGRLDDPTAVREVLRGSDAAVVVLGHKPDARVPYIADATKLIVSTMKTLEQSRLLVVTGAMIGEQTGAVANARVYRTPALASAST